MNEEQQWEVEFDRDAEGCNLAQWCTLLVGRALYAGAQRIVGKNRSYITKKLIAYIEERERIAFNEIDDLWISLNLREDNRENWNAELTRFSLLMQRRSQELNPKHND